MIRPFRYALTPACLAATVLSLAAPANAQTKPDPVQAIWAYAGSWKIETENFATAYSKAGHESSMLRNECWKTAKTWPAGRSSMATRKCSSSSAC